jgi:hypothetical protein
MADLQYNNLTDLRLSAILHAEITAMLADRHSLWGHDSIINFGDISGTGSTVLEVPQVKWGGDSMAAVAEGSSTTGVALTDASPSITIARQSLQRNISDLAVLTDSVGVTVPALAADMVGAAAARFQDMVCALLGSFTNNVGTSGNPLTVAQFLEASFKLTQNSVNGPYTAVLYPNQVTDFLSSLRSETGPIANWVGATQEIMAIKGQGYQGSFIGIDVYASSKVITANGGADSAGAVWGRGALGMAEGSPSALSHGDIQYPAGTPIMVEFERDSAAALTRIVGSYYVGVSELEDLRGCSIITDRG